eukprot:762530_1
MPPLLTFVARLSDGLPLVASFAQTSFNLDVQKKQAKDVLRNLNSNGRSVSKMSIETTDQKIFHYLIQQNICYLTLTEHSYPKRLAFLYLEEVADAFLENQDLSDIHSIMRQNITQVLDRGEKLENVSQISSNLMSESKKFKWGAKKLSFWAKVNTYAPIAAMGLFVIVVLWLKFFR